MLREIQSTRFLESLDTHTAFGTFWVLLWWCLIRGRGWRHKIIKEDIRVLSHVLTFSTLQVLLSRVTASKQTMQKLVCHTSLCTRKLNHQKQRKHTHTYIHKATLSQIRQKKIVDSGFGLLNITLTLVASKFSSTGWDNLVYARKLSSSGSTIPKFPSHSQFNQRVYNANQFVVFRSTIKKKGEPFVMDLFEGVGSESALCGSLEETRTWEVSLLPFSFSFFCCCCWRRWASAASLCFMASIARLLGSWTTVVSVAIAARLKLA